MWPVSSDFLDAVAGSHTAVSAATLGTYSTVEKVLTPNLVGGSVTVERGRANRRTLTLDLVDVDGSLMPSGSSSSLNPLAGKIIRPYRGVAFPGGTEQANLWDGVQLWDGDQLWDGTDITPDTTEMVPLGAFRITSVDPKDDEGGVQIQVEGVDLSWLLARAVWTSPWAISAGTSVTDAITAIMSDRAGYVTVDVDGLSYTLPPLITGTGSQDNRDPWQVIQELGDTAGVDVFFDQTGILTYQSAPTVLANPRLRYGPDDVRVVLAAERKFDADSAYNGVTVIGESVSNESPVKVSVWDQTPGSPTRLDGPYGNIPEIYQTGTITSTVQARTVAEQRLRHHLGVGVGLDWGMIVNPALDVNDIIQVERPNLNVAGQYVIDALTIPLSAREPMTVRGRTLEAYTLEIED